MRVLNPRPSVVELLLANDSAPESERMNDAQIAGQAKVTKATVQQVRARLRRKGQLQGTPSRQYRKHERPDPAGYADRVSIEKLMERAKILTEDQRKKLASIYAVGGEGAVKVQALKLLEDQHARSGEGVGPGEPMDDEDVNTRLRRLNEVVGFRRAWRAFSETYPPEGKPASAAHAEAGREVEAVAAAAAAGSGPAELSGGEGAGDPEEARGGAEPAPGGDS